jgi:hypothetical protein
MSFEESKYKLPEEFIKRFICYTVDDKCMDSVELFKMFISADPT